MILRRHSTAVSPIFSLSRLLLLSFLSPSTHTTSILSLWQLATLLCVLKSVFAKLNIDGITPYIASRRPGLEVYTTAVLGTDPLLVDVLVDKLNQSVAIMLA